MWGRIYYIPKSDMLLELHKMQVDICFCNADFFLCLWFNLRKALAVQSDVTGSGDKPHKDDANPLLGLTLIRGGQMRYVRDGY